MNGDAPIAAALANLLKFAKNRQLSEPIADLVEKVTRRRCLT